MFILLVCLRALLPQAAKPADTLKLLASREAVIIELMAAAVGEEPGTRAVEDDHFTPTYGSRCSG